MSLFSGLPYKDRLGNDIYPDFRNMIRLEAVIDDPDLNELERSVGCLMLLYGENIPDDIEAAYGELLWFYYRGEPPAKPTGRIKRVFDFSEDSAYIIGSFLAAYGLDLTDDSLHVHWWRFMSLFIALPDEATMMKRMCDRNVDTSKMKGEQRRYWETRQKAIALKSSPKLQSVSPEARRIEKQKRLDELYAEAEKELAKKEQIII